MAMLHDYCCYLTTRCLQYILAEQDVWPELQECLIGMLAQGHQQLGLTLRRCPELHPQSLYQW